MLKRIKLVPFLLILVLLGCAKKVEVHPGAISNLDSYTFDLLLVEQDALNQAKADFQAGKLPVAAKDALNYAISQYNITQAAARAYHDGGGDATKLQQALASLVAAVGELQKLIAPTKKPVPIAANYSFLRRAA